MIQSITSWYFSSSASYVFLFVLQVGDLINTAFSLAALSNFFLDTRFFQVYKQHLFHTAIFGNSLPMNAVRIIRSNITTPKHQTNSRGLA